MQRGAVDALLDPSSIPSMTPEQRAATRRRRSSVAVGRTGGGQAWDVARDYARDKMLPTDSFRNVSFRRKRVSTLDALGEDGDDHEDLLRAHAAAAATASAHSSSAASASAAAAAAAGGGGGISSSAAPGSAPAVGASMATGIPQLGSMAPLTTMSSTPPTTTATPPSPMMKMSHQQPPTSPTHTLLLDATPTTSAGADEFKSAVVKAHFQAKHSNALRTSMQNAGRSTEKVNLFGQSNVLHTVEKRWIKRAESLDRMYIRWDVDEDDEHDEEGYAINGYDVGDDDNGSIIFRGNGRGGGGGGGALSPSSTWGSDRGSLSPEPDEYDRRNGRGSPTKMPITPVTRSTLQAWDMIMTNRSGLYSDAAMESIDIEELRETAEIHKLARRKIHSTRSAGDDADLIQTMHENDFATSASQSHSSTTTPAALLQKKTAPSNARGGGAHSKAMQQHPTKQVDISRPKLLIYDRLASVRNKRKTAKDPKYRFSTHKQDGLSMYMEQSRRAQTAPHSSGRSRAYEFQYGISVLNPSLSGEQREAQMRQQAEWVAAQHQHARHRPATSSYNSRFSKKPLLSSYDFRKSGMSESTQRTGCGGGGARGDTKGAHASGDPTEVVGTEERLSPWLRRYSTAAWRDKTLGFSGKVWDVAFSKYKEETLSNEFDRMARHWAENTVRFVERSISLFHAGLVKNYIMECENVKIVEVINCGLGDHAGVPFLRAVGDAVTVLHLIGNRLGERSLRIIAEMLAKSEYKKPSSSSSKKASVAAETTHADKVVVPASEGTGESGRRRSITGKSDVAGRRRSVTSNTNSSGASSTSAVSNGTAQTNIAAGASSTHDAAAAAAAVLHEVNMDCSASMRIQPDPKRFLVELDLSGNSGGVRYQIVLDAMQTNRSVKHLKLSDCGFTYRAVGVLADMLRRNKHLKSLILSNNHFDTAACGKKLGEGIKVNKTLELLDLSSCSITDESAQSIFASLSDLFESQLRELRLGHNSIGKMACYAARYALKRNSYLEILGLESNPLGYQGVVQLFSAMAYSETLRLVRMDNVNFTPQQNRVESDFDPTSPVGEYRLCLEQPGQRSIAVQLVGVWKKQGKHVWQNAALDGKAFELTDAMGWPDAMPAEGMLTVDVIPPHERIKTTEEVAKTPIDDAVLEKLYYTKRIQDATPIWRAQYLKAMAMGFFYRCEQVATIIKSLVSNGETSQITSLVGCFFPRLLDIENMSAISELLDSEVLNLWEEVQARMGILGTFNPSSPNGRYVLDLSQFEHRYFCLKLQELERKELDDLESEYADSSRTMNPNVACVRNIMYNGTRQDRLKLYEWPVPKKGTVQLDYSTTRRSVLPVATDITIELVKSLLGDITQGVTEQEVLERIYELQKLSKQNAVINLIQSARSSDASRDEHVKSFMKQAWRQSTATGHRRRKRKGATDDASGGRVRILHILKVFTSKFCMTSKQVADVLSTEYTRSFTIECMVTLFPAIRDLSQRNVAMLAELMTRDEQIEFGSRLGIDKFHRYAPSIWYRVDLENSLELECLEYFTKLAYFSDNKTNFFEICIGGKPIKAPEDGSLYSYLQSRSKLYREPGGRPGQIIFRLDVGNHDRVLLAARHIQRHITQKRNAKK